MHGIWTSEISQSDPATSNIFEAFTEANHIEWFCDRSHKKSLQIVYKVANWKFHSIARNVPVSMFDVRNEGRESLGIGTKEYLKCLNNPEDKCTLENAMCFFLFEHGSDIGGFQNFLPLSARLIDWKVISAMGWEWENQTQCGEVIVGKRNFGGENRIGQGAS